MRAGVRRAAVLLPLALFAAGCWHLPFRARKVRECPGAVVSTRESTGEFLLRQRIRIESGGERFAMQLVVQKRGDELVLVGLNPIGAVLFTLRQRGTQIELDSLPPPMLEIPPANLLRDFHRIHTFEVADSAADGATTAHVGDTEIREIWEGGVLRLREFRPLGAPAADTVQLRFEPQRVSIANGACDYRAEVVTLSEEPLL